MSRWLPNGRTQEELHLAREEDEQTTMLTTVSPCPGGATRGLLGGANRSPLRRPKE